MPGGGKKPDPVELASEESFPASDPPAWIPAAAGAGAAGHTVTSAVLVRLVAKPGFEADVRDLLVSALPTVKQESETSVWFAVQIAPRTFGLFGAFPDEGARDTHLNGHLGARLVQLADDYLSVAPSIEPCDVLVSKLP